MRLKYPCLKLADWNICPVVKRMPPAEVVPPETPGSAPPFIFTRGDREKVLAIGRIELAFLLARRDAASRIGDGIMRDIQLKLNLRRTPLDFDPGIKFYFPFVFDSRFGPITPKLFSPNLSLRSAELK